MNQNELQSTTRPEPSGVLVLMGSGELSPSMVEVHKAMLQSTGDRPLAVFVDTPAGFQLNVDQISRRAQEYFQTRVGFPLQVASLKSRVDIDTAPGLQALRLLENADFILMGPGSPTYAARQWIGTPVQHILRSRVEKGAVVTAASAAALTMGWKTLPVYEIYKVGMDLHWVDGLDLLGPWGLRLVIVPHWNNAEGGTHDTRYCYMGERRFGALERLLPDGVTVVGIDEHTALILDFARKLAMVRGVGSVTLRWVGARAPEPSRPLPEGDAPFLPELKSGFPGPDGLPPDRQGPASAAIRERIFMAGETFPLDLLRPLPTDRALQEEWRRPAPSESAGGAADRTTPSSTPSEVSSTEDLWDDLRRLEPIFERGLENRSPIDAARALLDLDRLLWQALEHGAHPEEVSQGREVFREWLVHTTQRLSLSIEDRRRVLEPVVAELVQLREQFRGKRLWEPADALRVVLSAQGITVEDTPSGPRWRWRDS